jgi:Arc/MetJ-type ribon-helix-helix transcriptional regulator
MVIGMATTKITITLDDEQLAAVRTLVKSGKADSVSGFVQHAVSVSLADVSGWGAMLGLALRATGGPLKAKERAWADEVLRGSKRGSTSSSGSKPSRNRRSAA